MIGNEILRICNDSFPDIVWHLRLQNNHDYGVPSKTQITFGSVGGRKIEIQKTRISHPDRKPRDYSDTRTVPGYQVDIEGGQSTSGTDLFETIVAAVMSSAQEAAKTSKKYSDEAKALHEFEAIVMKQAKK